MRILLVLLLFAPFIAMADQKDNNLAGAQTEAQGPKIESMLRGWERRYEKELRENPPLPPWLKFPTYDRYSLGWRMGAGESYMQTDIGAYFHFSSEDEKERYKLRYPAPIGWEGWYDE